MAEWGRARGRQYRREKGKKGVGGSDEENLRVIHLRSEMFQRNPVERVFTLCLIKMFLAFLFGFRTWTWGYFQNPMEEAIKLSVCKIRG